MGLTFNNGRNAAVMTSTSSLSVGINCTPNAQFEVLGSTGGALTDGIRVSRNTLQSSQYGVINYTSGILNLTGVNTSGGGEIRLNTSDGTTTNERMRITSTGNVGIGTSSPSDIFQVVGTAATIVGVRTQVSTKALPAGGTTFTLTGSSTSGLFHCVVYVTISVNSSNYNYGQYIFAGQNGGYFTVNAYTPTASVGGVSMSPSKANQAPPAVVLSIGNTSGIAGNAQITVISTNQIFSIT